MTQNRQLDLGSMTLYDFNAVQLGETHEKTIQNITTQLVCNIQFIFNALVEAKKQQITVREALPQEEQIHNFDESKINLKLPESGILFPRSRKIPQEKPPTKWQKFEKEKGIKKRNRTGMEYDPTLKTQVARWGKRSKKNIVDIPIMEEKRDGRNPFLDQQHEKQLKVYKNKLKQLKNKQFSGKNQKH